MTFSVGSTLATPCEASLGLRATCLDDIRRARQEAAEAALPLLVLGQGSNVVLHRHLQRYALLMSPLGKAVQSEQGNVVYLQVQAGEDWPALVQWTLQQGWYGLENLSLIPGSVGAAPVQNIGAYGVELMDRVSSVTLLTPNDDVVTLAADDCGFGYRTSRFQGEPEHIILSVTLRLSTEPNVVLTYPELQERMARTVQPTPAEVAQAVIDIRQAKLPDPRQVPNAGSFFKNPIVDADFAKRLQGDYPHLKTYPAGQIGEETNDTKRKLSAAQLLDAVGAKSLRTDGVTSWSQQALVLINPQRVAADVVLLHAEKLQARVQEQFGVLLQLEPSVFD